MFGELRKPGFWLGVIAVVVALRWIERTVPMVRAITNPGGSATA